MEGTSCSKSLTMTKWYKYPLDNILLSLRWETIWPVGFELCPSYSSSNLLEN